MLDTGGCLNSKSVGEITEVIILAELIKQGYSVSLPFGDNQRYDMIVDWGGILLKAQCKTGKLVDGSIITNVCSLNPFTNKQRDYHGEIDIFLIYCPGTKSIYKIPIELTGKRKLNLRVNDIKVKNNRVKWAKHYLLGPSD